MVERLAQVHADIALHFDLARADSEYAEAFRAYGADLDRLDPAEAGALLASSPIALGLANGLDQWTFLRRGPLGPEADANRRQALDEGARRLVAIAKAADPDPWRNRLRDTLAGAEADRGRALDDLRRLAATADAGRLPEASVTRLASALASLGDRELAIGLLRGAQRAHPDDFWVNSDLARELNHAGRPDEAVRFLSAALAVRPRSEMALRDLGNALRAAGRAEEAAAYPGDRRPPPRRPGRRGPDRRPGNPPPG